MSARLIDLPWKEINPLIRGLSDAGFDRTLTRTLRAKDNAERAVQVLQAYFYLGRMERSIFGRINGVYTDPHEQVQRTQIWNDVLGWGFRQELEWAINRCPSIPKDPDLAVTLVPYFAADDPYLSLQRTFEELWFLIELEHGMFRCHRDLSWNPRLLQLKTVHDEAKTQRLEWEIINLRGSNETADPKSWRFPGIGIMAAAVQHPGWIQKMDLGKMPPVNLGGIRAYRDHSSTDEETCPLLERDQGVTRLSFVHPKARDKKYSTPFFAPAETTR